MKHSLIFLIILLIGGASCAQNSSKLIVRVDDMGFTHSGNVAIIKTVKEGIATSLEILVPSPWFPEAVKMLQKHPDIDVGIHLTLTSEWNNMKYRPVSHCPSITDEDGYFFPFIWPNKNYPGYTITENNWNIADVEKEFRAQIELALKKLPNITHVSAHMGCFDLSPEVKMLVKNLAKEYKIDIDPEEYNVERATYEGPKLTTEQKIDSFIKMIETLKPGRSYLFVDHPGMDTPELRAIHHFGYDNVAIDRQGVTDLLINEKVKEALKQNNVELISYGSLKK